MLLVKWKAMRSVDTSKLSLSRVCARWNTRIYTVHMHWMLFSYCQLASRMRVYIYFFAALAVRSRFHRGFQATPVAIEISGRRCFAILFPQPEDISGWVVRLSPFLHVNFSRALGGSRSFHELRLPFMLILTLIRKYKYMGQSQGKKKAGTICSDFIRLLAQLAIVRITQGLFKR